MGCDFYEIRRLIITFKDSNNEIIDIPIEIDKIPHWLSSFGDSDESDDDKLEEEMNRIATAYGTKIIYNNNNWVIKSKNRMEFYMDYVNKYKKNDYELHSIIKNTYCYERQ